MALSNMVVFDKYYIPATIETLGQMVDKFNGASNGAIQLTSEGFEGDFFANAFYSALQASRRRVDMYASNDAVSSTALAQVKENGVKVAGGFGPIVFEPAQMNWINAASADAIEAISRMMAEAIIQDQLNTSIASLAAAIGNQSTATNDVSAGADGAGALTYVAMNNAHAKFGDNSQNLVAQVMTGAAYHKLVGVNLANAVNLFQASGVLVVDILGKPVIVTDAPALYVTGTPNKLKVLSLASGAATIYDGSQPIINVDTTNNKIRIETTLQADYNFGVALKGYSWDTANGGKSPSDAELATGSNWDKVATDIKHTAGVITIADAAQ